MCDVDDGGCRYCTHPLCCDKGRPFARAHTGLGWLPASVRINDVVTTGLRIN